MSRTALIHLALEGLRRFLGGQKATLVWDGLAAHRGKLLRAWLGRQRSWLVVEPRPTTPELNPVGPLWASLKGTRWANLAGDTPEESNAAAERGIQRIRATPHLPFSFLRSCGLSPCENTSLEPATLVGLAHAGSR